MKKISTIIPVYNAEPYLVRCIESVENQNLDNCELICVDDGSTDKSVELLEELQKKYNNLIIIRQENQNAGVARNNGLKIAKGEYIHFMDADDFLLPEVYSKIYDIARNNQLDYLKFKCKILDLSTENINDDFPAYSLSDIHNYFNIKLDFYRDFYVFKYHTPTPWSGIVERKLLIKYNICFNSLKCCNDRSFYIDVLLHAKNIMIADVFAVCHQINNKSSLVGKRVDNFNCHFQSIKIIMQMLADIPVTFKNTIIAAEIEDMFYWYLTISDEKIRKNITEQIYLFLHNLDKELFNDELLSNSYTLKFFHNDYADEFLNKFKIYDGMDLFQCFTKSNSVVIYGAGQVAEVLVQNLKHIEKLYHKIRCIIVSNTLDNPEQVEGIPVCGIDVINDRDSLVIIATLPDVYMEIINNLENHGFSNIKIIDRAVATELVKAST